MTRADPPSGEKGWVSVELRNELVQRWVRDPASNRGIILLDADEARNYSSTFRSSDYEDAAMRPRLLLAFSSPLPRTSPAPARKAP